MRTAPLLLVSAYQLSASILISGSETIVHHAKTLVEVKRHLANLPHKSTLFIDVDDTLITPLSRAFRATSPWREMIGDIKKNRATIPNAEYIISNWRRTRKTMLVDEAWPLYIQELKKNHPVFALTQIDTGKVGSIDSMERWRANELASFGIEFSRNAIIETAFAESYTTTNASCYQGILMTGKRKKSEVIAQYHLHAPSEHIVFIDDKREMIDDVIAWCTKNNQSCTAIHFRAVDGIDGAPDPIVAEYQKQHLLAHAEWLEDEEAQRRLNEITE